MHKIQQWFSNAQNDFLKWMLGIAFLEILSFATVFNPPYRAAATIIAGLIMLVVAMKRPALGLAILLFELMVGSQGSLLKIPNGWEVNGGISLRIVLFAAFFLGWALNAALEWKKTRAEFKQAVFQELRKRKAWIAVLVICIWAVIRGAWLKNEDLWTDANAWAFLLLLVPVIYVALRSPEGLKRHCLNAIAGGLFWLPLKTLMLFYAFTHGLSGLSQPLYLWVRRTGVGEVTLVTGNLFRIFMQSQIYALGGALFFLGRQKEGDRFGFPWFLVGIGSVATLILCLSRSIWAGCAVGAAALLILCYKRRRQGKADVPKPWRIIWRIIGGSAIALGIIGGIVWFPYPRVDVGSLASLISSRGTLSDAAAESRWNLLPVLWNKIKKAPILGSGFGAAVTYKSMDPRAQASPNKGLVTTYAFEWGWLEFWIKFGFIGIVVMAWLLASIGLRWSRSPFQPWVRISGFALLAGLAVVHFFTPYLNHPLGFGFLLAAEGFMTASNHN
ncbi:O-antigen ligase family protein [Patescibacteria group bacterium]|nr:O-antigen ligase family protein [Patescibacteria group bacterium]